ncbi:MAG: hypothetical protein KAV87_27850 [Desulfobacteraceae bacterium]|nr:hypothetical protein [Desulfobacteraceae bacterium]
MIFDCTVIAFSDTGYLNGATARDITMVTTDVEFYHRRLMRLNIEQACKG